MTPSLDTELLRTFVAIADAGSFTRAAQTVNRTQSAVSMQIKRLEEAVGRPLFLRDGRSVALSDAGEALLGYARRILRLHEEAVSVLTEPELAGTVRLGTPDDYASRFLPPILVRFARSHPRVQVEVHCEPSRKLRAALEKEELDLALVTCPPGEENGEILRREPVIWATSERHQVHVEEPLPLAVFHSGCIFRAWAIRALDAAGRSYRIAYSSPSIAGIQAAVLSGLAVTALGQSTLAPGMRALGVEEGFPTLPASTIALLRAPGRRSRVIDSLARQVADCFRSLESEAA